MIDFLVFLVQFFLYCVCRVKKDDVNELPNEYKSNNVKENLVLSFAENFRRQFVHLYRDRKPLLLNPLNECGTEVKYSAFIKFGWQGCSSGLVK